MPTRGRSPDHQPRWSIEDILARTDLARLLDDYAVPAAHNLRNRRWHCPDPHHDDHRASVTMRTDHRGHERWRCWSGDHRGDAIDLVMIAQGVDRRDALGDTAAAIQHLVDGHARGKVVITVPDRAEPPTRRE